MKKNFIKLRDVPVGTNFTLVGSRILYIKLTNEAAYPWTHNCARYHTADDYTRVLLDSATNILLVPPKNRNHRHDRRLELSTLEAGIVFALSRKTGAARYVKLPLRSDTEYYGQPRLVGSSIGMHASEVNVDRRGNCLNMTTREFVNVDSGTMVFLVTDFVS